MSPRLKPADRRYLIGGSDARIIMGNDEPALVRLWREKRGEVEPEDLSDQSHRPARGRTEPRTETGSNAILAKSSLGSNAGCNIRS